jgi:hypothetical protein
VDGDITTYFDGPTTNGNWVGLDLGSAKQIVNIRFFPRTGFASRMTGGIFQAANVSEFSTAINLWTISNAPPDSTFTAQVITNTTPFRYVRYLSPAGSYGDVAEVQLFGPSPSAGMLGSPSPPGGLSASPGNMEVALPWTGSSGASSYNVKRAFVSGGPYTTVANTTATLYMDTGLAGGTYYYVVSAVGAGESANSAEASATVNCPVTIAPTGLNATAQNGQLLLAWTPVTTGTSPTIYNVLRSTNSSGPFIPLAIGLAATNYCDTTALSNTTYYYLVQAVNTCGQSLNSSTVGITPLSPPSLGASFSGNQLLVLSWPTWIGDYALYTTTNLASPASWQPITNSPQASNDTLSVSLQVTNASQQFFRLISK